MTLQTIESLLLAALAIDLAAIALWYACSWPASQVLGPALVRGPAAGKRLALTFDDGPLAPSTGQILDVLKSRGVHATFFVCGSNAEQYPEIVRRIHSEGHTLGNHTWSHPYLYFLSGEKMAEEIDRTQEAVRAATGQIPRLFRPPYGGRWFGLYALLRERKMDLIQWSLDPQDWQLDANGILARARSGLQPGAVILLHDGRQAPCGYLRRLLNRDRPAEGGGAPTATSSATVEALPALIDHARKEGFQFVPLEEFLRG
jgi:peptidoglycan-N-acetylglucosamine deacetylase